MCRHFGNAPAAKIPQQFWTHVAIYQPQADALSMQAVCNYSTGRPTDISSYACVHVHPLPTHIDTQGRLHSMLPTVALLPLSLSSLLSQACIDDNVDMVTFLVEHGASINQPDNEGWIPLHAAASCGYIDIAE